MSMASDTRAEIVARFTASGVDVQSYADQYGGSDAPVPVHTVWIAQADSQRDGGYDLDNVRYIVAVFATLEASYPELAFQIASSAHDGGMFHVSLTETAMVI